MSLTELSRQLEQTWSADTSAKAYEWSAENPARGQCAVTALIVQDVYGGELLRCIVNGESRYYNRLPGGEEVDLTWSQFRNGTKEGIEVRDREYVLSFPDTTRRYRLLRSRLQLPAA